MDPIKQYISLIVERELSKLGIKDKPLDVPVKSSVGKIITPDVADIVKSTYKDIGGYEGADTPEGLKKKITDYFVADVDDDPEPDAAILYTNWSGSVKASAFATDGGKEAKEALKKMIKTMFSRPNTWIEVSGAPANVMIKKLGLKTVEDEEHVRSLLPDFEITWHGKHPGGVPYGAGWYTRDIAGKPETKIIVGNPPKSL